MADNDLNADGSVDTDDLNQAILESAIEGIDQVTVGDTTVREKPLSERIAAANHVAAQSAASNASMGLRFTKLISPGGIC